MAKIDITYHNLLDKILQEGYTYEDPNRKGVNRLEILEYTFRHEFKDGFPAITTKKLNYKSVVTELIWFLRGDTNIKYLVDNGCNIWNKDAYNYYLKWLKSKNLSKKDFKMFSLDFEQFIETVKEGFKDKNYTYGDLGPVYGAQWREIYDKKADDISRYDQIKTLINTLKNNPLGTQHIVNAWNVLELDDMALQPCHYGFQVVVRPLQYMDEMTLKNLPTNWEIGNYITFDKNVKYGFELHWSQRSVDTFLGLPFNIVSYATLALILEKITGYKALAIQGDLKKVHLYDNSLDAVKEQLSRDVDKYGECELLINPVQEQHLKNGSMLDIIINSLELDDFKLINYESFPHIKVEMLSRNNQ